MRIDALEEKHAVIVLSERNLESLLRKARRAGSARTLLKAEENGVVYVRCETDEEHYGNRVPGAVHPLDDPDVPPADAYANELGRELGL